MVAFEVWVNGKRRYIAGHRDARLLTVWLNGSLSYPAGMPTSFTMLGSVAIPDGNSGQLETLSYPHAQLAIGDEIVIRIVDVDRVDEPGKPDDGVYRIEFGASE